MHPLGLLVLAVFSSFQLQILFNLTVVIFFSFLYASSNIAESMLNCCFLAVPRYGQPILRAKIAFIHLLQTLAVGEPVQ